MTMSKSFLVVVPAGSAKALGGRLFGRKAAVSEGGNALVRSV